MTEQAVDAVEMARLLGVAPKTIVATARRGEVPAFKAPRHWRFFPSKVQAHLEAPRDPWAQSARSRSRRRVA
jgi:excisionase family DNA binding protein